MPRFMKVFMVLFAFAFIGTLGAMIIGGIWNYRMYQDCINDGHKSYECSAMLSQRSQGVVIDDISDR